MQQTRQSLETNQAALARRISNQVLGGEPLDVVWNLTLAANLISANVQYEQIEAIQAVPGVKEVVLETRYEPAVYSQGTADPSMATSGEMIGTSAAYAAGYTGAGMRIAVIDTGTDTDHKSFDADAFAYALAEDEKASGEAYDLLDAAEIGAVLPQLHPESWQSHSYVACCGTSIQPVLKLLERQPQINTVLLCLDNDEAGHLASRRMKEQLAERYTVERLIPAHKDWNDDLTAEEPSFAQVMQ